MRHGSERGQAERGSGGVFLVFIVGALLLLVGLTFDGGRILSARREAYAVANEAAIAGAQEVDESALRRGEVIIDPDRAAHTARVHLDATGASGAITSDGAQLRVQVSRTVPLSFLSVIGMSERTVEATASVRLVRGIEEADQ